MKNTLFTLPGGIKVVLNHITFASPSFENEIGIKGKAQLPNGQFLNVDCNAE